jgi:ComF family protein
MAQQLSTELKCWLDTGLSFFYPEACQFCDRNRATPVDGYICAECWKNVRFIQPPVCDRCGLPYEGDVTTDFECSNCREMELHFRWARSAVAARGMVLDLIHRYKYQRALWLEPFLADLLARQAAPVLRNENWHMIVPVPLHSLKKCEREFNQAERLAARLSQAVHIPLNNRALKRVVPTKTQTLLSRSQRAENVRRAFALGSAEGLRGKQIVVVDDVFTTGATTSACAKVLLDGGAAEVCVWTLARGI